MHQQNPQTLSVSELNKQVRQLLESGFSVLTIEGEISNFVCPSSGHWYFTLKDRSAQVRCALFKNRNRFLKYKPRNGDQVKLRAKVSLYEGRGEFQLIGDYLEEAGAGALQAAFDALKTQLEREGLFSQERKRSLPTLPRHIGVITSPTGAAVRDIVSVLNRRFPAIPVSIFPVVVQGEEAPQQIINALELANRDGRCDVIILGRGGGSLEDLWAFNNEYLARAIVDSDIPIVSAVGHEVDFSISDFVADLRAPTPSAAAELLSPDSDTLIGQFRYYEEVLARQFKRKTELLRLRLAGTSQRLRHPGQRLQEQAQKLDELELRLKRQLAYRLNLYQQSLSHLDNRLAQQSPERKIDRLQTRQQELYSRLKRGIKLHLEKYRLRLASQSHGLQAVSPLATLSRGYAIVSDQQGHIVQNSSEVRIGDTLEARLAKGRLQCQVTETIEVNH